MMKYIVACCWQKMHRRMSQWQSKSFTSLLTRISDDDLHWGSNYASSMGHPKRMDSALIKPIIDLHNSIVQDKLQIPGFLSSGLPKLAAMCRRVRSSQRVEGLRVYTKDTCVEFHQFFVAVLKGYRDALMKWKKIYEVAKKAQMGDVQWGHEETARYIELRDACAIDVYNFGHLLWRIAYSQALRDHLGLLAANQRIVPPVYDYYKQCVYTHDESGGGEAAGQDWAGQEAEEEAQELQQLMERGDVVLVYQRWIQLQVTQWAALDVLSSYSRRAAISLQGADISISLLFMNLRHSGKMKDWRAMIRQLVRQRITETSILHDTLTSALDAEKVIGVIEEKIKQHAAPGAHTIFRKFEKDCPDLRCHIHCEAVLAYLLKYADSALIPKGPAYEAIKVMSHLPNMHGIC
jgi:hypothetical protein